MTDPRRVVVARYLLAADRHFREAAEKVGTDEYDPHIEAAITAQRAATDELLLGVEEQDIERRLREWVG